MSLSNSTRTLLISCGLVALSLVAARMSQGQEAPAARRDNNLAVVHEFLRTAYPAYEGQFLNLCVAQQMDAPWHENYKINFEIKKFDQEQSPHPMNDPKTGKRLKSPENTTLLQGEFQFGDGEHIEWVSTSALENKRYESVRDAVQSHPNWSEADAKKALRDAGARYGPDQKEAFLQSIQLERLDKFLGHLKMVSVEFDAFANADHVGDFALLFWIVKADAQLPDGSSRTYSFLFEPFEGRLVSVKHLP